LRYNFWKWNKSKDKIEWVKKEWIVCELRMSASKESRSAFEARLNSSGHQICFFLRSLSDHLDKVYHLGWRAALMGFGVFSTTFFSPPFFYLFSCIALLIFFYINFGFYFFNYYFFLLSDFKILIICSI
jgi:hypothetical protein